DFWGNEYVSLKDQIIKLENAQAKIKQSRETITQQMEPMTKELRTYDHVSRGHIQEINKCEEKLRNIEYLEKSLNNMIRIVYFAALEDKYASFIFYCT